MAVILLVGNQSSSKFNVCQIKTLIQSKNFFIIMENARKNIQNYRKNYLTFCIMY